MADDDVPLPPATERLGNFLPVSRGVIRGALLKQSDAGHRGGTPARLGDLLIEAGAITREELEVAVRKQRVARLRLCPLFSVLGPTELSAISAKFREVSIPAGQVFIVQEEEDPKLYVVAAGELEVFRTLSDGREIHIAKVGPGEPIGEMGYFQGGKRTASVRALLPSELLCAEYDELTHYFEHVPRVAHAFIEVVERRRQELASRVEQASA
jgi:CRP-like cAMP-binding protein